MSLADSRCAVRHWSRQKTLMLTQWLRSMHWCQSWRRQCPSHKCLNVTIDGYTVRLWQPVWAAFISLFTAKSHICNKHTDGLHAEGSHMQRQLKMSCILFFFVSEIQRWLLLILKENSTTVAKHTVLIISSSNCPCLVSVTCEKCERDLVGYYCSL